MSKGIARYYAAAFNAKPKGMILPPNWLGVAAVGMLGVLNPGVWLIGAGVELAYLHLLANNARFQRVVDAKKGASKADEGKINAILYTLTPMYQRRYEALRMECQGIVENQRMKEIDSAAGVHTNGLGRLLWIYLKLLQTRELLGRLWQDRGAPPRLPTRSSTASEEHPALREVASRIADIEAQLRNQGLADDLRKSLAGRLEILQTRAKTLAEARDKLQFVDAELVRIEEQVRLINEQVLTATDASDLSLRIDSVTSTLGDTTRWISEQRELDGLLDDLDMESASAAMEQQLTAR